MSALRNLLRLAENLVPTGVIGDGTVAEFHSQAARVRTVVSRIHNDKPPSAPGTLGSRAPRTRQCCVTVDELSPESQGRMEWRQRHYGPRGLDPSRCAHRAEYIVNDREVCARHAGMLSLEILLKGTEK